MLRIVFFARVKEELGCAGLELEWSDNLNTLDALKAQLYSRDDGRWHQVLSESNIICAVNHTVVNGNIPVDEGDEIAFFPPVTGG